MECDYANGLINSVIFNKSGTMMKVHSAANVHDNPRGSNLCRVHLWTYDMEMSEGGALVRCQHSSYDGYMYKVEVTLSSMAASARCLSEKCVPLLGR